MTGTNQKPDPSPIASAASDAARLLQHARIATLATLDHATKHPYASLVTTALDSDGAPLLLISSLARHTKNLDADPRASLLIAHAGTAQDDPLTQARVTLIGTFAPTQGPTARTRFLANHPGAEGYASFADFRFVRMLVHSAHFIGGFGRIIELSASDLNSALSKPAG